MPFFNRKIDGKVSPSLNSISFDTSQNSLSGEVNGQRVWHTTEGDGVGLSFFPVSPNLPSQTKTKAELREFYSESIGNENVKIVEFRILPLADVVSILMVLRIPQASGAVTYVGSLTFPFAEFSFVIKMQCEERGVTGIREAIVLDQALKTGAFELDTEGKIKSNLDPDDPSFDTLDSNHPLTRLRREFARIIASVQIEESTRRARRFDLPPVG